MARKTARRPIRPEDLLRYRFLSDPQIAPDGRRVLFTHKEVGPKNDYRTTLWIVASDGGGDARPFTTAGKDSQGRWSPDGRRIAFLSGRDQPGAQIFVAPSDGGEASRLTQFDEGSIAGFKWAPDGRQLAVLFRATDPEWTAAARKQREEAGGSIPARVLDDIWYRLDGDGYFNHQRYHLHVVDAVTGAGRVVFAENRAPDLSFDWAPDSRRLAVTANLDREAITRPWLDRLFIVDVASGRRRLVPGQGDGLRGSVAWSPDGKWLAWAGREGRENIWGSTNTHLFVTDARSGATRNLSTGGDCCLTATTLGDTREASFSANLRFHPDSKSVFTQIGWHGETHLAAAAIAGGGIKLLTKGAIEHTLGNWSADGTQLAGTVGSALELGEVAVLGLHGGRLETRRLTALNAPLLDELEIVAPEAHWIQSTGGTRVQAWVLKPARSTRGRQSPAVLAVHGGPHAQYGLSFFHELQLHAARGYVVVYGNPRGSKGYGEKHCDAIRGKWGGADWDDVQAIRAFIGNLPYVDAKRVGIMGGSYGGYMANWAIGHSDAFRAAITDRSVSNLVSMSGSSDYPNVPDQYWPGAPWDRPEELWEQSPIAHLAGAKTPTLVIHSEGDLRCNVEQGEQVFTALKLLGVKTRLVRYPSSTSHGMSRSGPPDLRLHRLEQILAWWKEHLG